MSGIPEPRRHAARAGFFAMPSSVAGRIAAALFIAAVFAVALMAIVVEPAQPGWRTAFGLLIVVLVASTAASGVIAVFAQRERSWAVVLPTITCLGVVVNEVLQQLRAQ